MAKLKVIVPRLNKRRAPVADFSDKTNIVGEVLSGFEFESKAEEVNSLGKWVKDGDGYFYWGNGCSEVTSELIQILNYAENAFDITKHWWLQDYHIDNLWGMGLTGLGVKIAVLDTGVALPHPDLNINQDTNCSDITDSRDTQYQDIDGHGTHCIGIIKGSNNGFGVTGIAYDSELFAIKVTRDKNIDDISFIETGIKKAIELGVDIISISKCFYDPSTNIQETIQKAFLEKNVLFVCAGGNQDEGGPYNEILHPAIYNECLSVGALEKGKLVSSSTIISDKLKLLAPGINIGSTYINKGYADLSGSSQAAPFVAGVAALVIQYLRAKNKKYTAKGLHKLLFDASDQLSGYTPRIINPLNILTLIDHETDINI
jgi:subtilisin family serine protease